MCLAVGCLPKHSVDTVHSPRLTTLSDSCADSYQLNADIHRCNPAGGFEPLAAVNVRHDLTMSQDTQCIVSAAGQPHPSSHSEDEQCDLTQCSVADIGSVVSCDASPMYAGELVSLLKFPLHSSPDSVATDLCREVDHAVMMDKGNSDCHIGLQLSGVQPAPVLQPSADHLSLLVSADQHGSMSSNADAGGAGNSCISQPVDSHTNKRDGDTDLPVSISISGKTSLLTATDNADKRVDSLNKTAESDDSCSGPGTTQTQSQMKQSEYTETLTDKTGFGSIVSLTVDPLLDRVQSDTVTDFRTVATKAQLAGYVTDMQCVGSSTITATNYTVHSGKASSSVSVELGCIPHDGHLLPINLEVLSNYKCLTSDSDVRKPVGMTDDQEQTGKQMKPILLETVRSDDAMSIRNVSDGSVTSDVLLSAVQTSVTVSTDTAAHCGSMSRDAYYCTVTGSYDSVGSWCITTQHSGTVMHSNAANDDHSHNTNIDEAEIAGDIGSKAQQSTKVTQNPADVRETDLALPLHQDSSSEFDEDDLGDDVKVILAKYRIRHGPVGSDSVPVASCAAVGNVSTLDATNSLLQNGLPKDSSDAVNVDTYSDSSDDALASRVRALLIEDHQQSSGRTLPTTTVNDVSSHGASSVSSVCSSRSTSVDYNNLSRQLSEIQMKLDSMRNGEKSSVGSQYSSSSSPYVCSPVTDMCVLQESLGVLVQQKTHVDQLLQDSLVGHAGDCSQADYCRSTSKDDVATSDVKHAEAGTLKRDIFPSAHLRDMSPGSMSSIGGTGEPLTAPRDLLQATKNVNTVQQPAMPAMSLSLTSVSSTKVIDSCSSLPSESLYKSSESFTRRSELMSSADDVQDTLSNHQQILPVGQTVSVSDIDMQDSSAVGNQHDTVSLVSSLQTDIHQSNSSSCTELVDRRLVVEAAVSELEHNLSNVIHTGRHDTLTTDALREAQLLKSSSAESSVHNQLLTLSDDEYSVSETGLSQGYSDSCDLSPVSKHSPLNINRSIHNPLLAVELDKTTTAQFNHNVELLSSLARSDNSIVKQSSVRNMQHPETSSHLRIEHGKQNRYKIPKQSILYNDIGKSTYMVKSYSVGSSEPKVTFDAKFESTGDLEFTPLTELPCSQDSSISGSYDADNEQPLTDRQSYDGNHELKNYEDIVEQQLSVGRTVTGCDVISALCVDATCSTQTIASHSSADINLLPYQ